MLRIRKSYCVSWNQGIDGALVQVNSPEMILLEKIRAICQQFEEYEEIVKTKTLTPRAKDFYDIIQIKEGFKIDFFSETNLQLLKYIFEAKNMSSINKKEKSCFFVKLKYCKSIN